MPRNARSLRITDIYRQRLVELRDRGATMIERDWQLVDVDNLDRSHPDFARAAAAGLAALQTTGVRLTAAYLTAFLRSELGQPVAGPPRSATRYAGTARTGRPLTAALVPTLITVKHEIANGKTPVEAGRAGAHQAVRLAMSETMAPARAALADTIRADARIVGWNRVTAGGCGACLGAATRTYGPDEPLHVHDGCRCSAEPVIAGVPDSVTRPDGHHLFNHLTVEQQNTLLGDEKANLIRSGRAPLDALVAVSPMVAIDDQITEAPLEALQAQTA